MIVFSNKHKIIFWFPPVISVLHLAEGHDFRTPGSLICVISSLPEEHHGWIELAQCQQSIGSTWDENVSRIVLSLQKSEPHVHCSLIPPFDSSCFMHSCRFWLSWPQVRTTLMIPPVSKLQTNSPYFHLNEICLFVNWSASFFWRCKLYSYQTVLQDTSYSNISSSLLGHSGVALDHSAYTKVERCLSSVHNLWKNMEMLHSWNRDCIEVYHKFCNRF